MHHFVLVILVVAVSISLFAGLLINSWTLKKSVDKYLYETSMPDIWVETNAINLADEDFFAEYFNYDKRLFLQQKVTAESKEYNAIQEYDEDLVLKYYHDGRWYYDSAFQNEYIPIWEQ